MSKVLANNWLYGQVSVKLAGRLDSEVVANGCQELVNMTVHRQGYISRRPPLKYICDATGYSFFIPFTIDVTNSFVIMVGANKIGVFDKREETITELTLPTSWQSLTEVEAKNIRSAVYYNDCYMVHQNHPLLRLTYTGVSSSPFILSTPSVIVNQDLTASDIGVSTEDFNSGYGQDSFNECQLNKSIGNYASEIGIISERLWLAGTIADPSTLYISRPYGTSQKVDHATSNNSILDFIQFQAVKTEQRVVKADEDMPVAIQYDSSGDIVYLSTTINQILWIPPVNSITTKGQLSTYENANGLDVEYTGLQVSLIKYRTGANYIYWDSTDEVYKLSSNDTVLDVEYENGWIKRLYKDSTVYASAEPYYAIDTSSGDNFYESKDIVDKVATSSTGMQFQLASGRNDKITWIGMCENIIVGTENAEWTMSTNINALNSNTKLYSVYGSPTGLHCSLGTDCFYIQRGNGLRMLYADYYGMHDLEITVTNPDILNGDIIQMIAVQTPEPSLLIVKADGTIVCCNIDRGNNVQAFSNWKASNGNVLSLSVIEDKTKQEVVALIEDGEDRFVCVFDNDTNHYADEKEEGEFKYDSHMTTMPFDAQTQDGSTTLGNTKTVKSVVFRAYNTGTVETFTDPKVSNITLTDVAKGGVGDFRINVNGGSTRDSQLTVKAYGKQSMNLLAMAYEIGVSE